LAVLLLSGLDGTYVVINAYKFTVFEILYCASALSLHIESTDSNSQL